MLHKFPLIMLSVLSFWLLSKSPTRNIAESYRRAAVFVDKILKGTKPSVKPPMKFELVLGLKNSPNRLGCRSLRMS